MMITDRNKKRFYATEVRNRAEQAKLEEELANLERQKQKELKMLNIQRQKFKTKYSRSVKEVSEVTMYKTHYPGFCYTRTGEQRHLPRPERTTSLQFEHIRSLIFTDGEVDLEKVLCLHLLSAHRTETLTPPKRKVRLMCREHSPTERLVDKSKRGFTNFERLSKLLPLFTIELIEQETFDDKMYPLINDGRLASRVLINEKVMALINTVVTALEKTNMEKFRHLVLMGNNPGQMRKMLDSLHIAEFLDSLSNHKLINSCDSFVLTPPFRIRVQNLDVKTSHGTLEVVVSHLRENVLQPPARKTHDLKDIAQADLFEESNTSPSMERNAAKSPTWSPRTSSRMNHMAPETSKATKTHTKDTNARFLDDEPRVELNKKIDFIARNKKLAAKTRKIEYDVDDDDWDVTPRRQSSSSSARSKIKSLEPAPAAKPSLSVLTEVDSRIEKIESLDHASKEESKSSLHQHEETPFKRKKRQVWENPVRKSNIRHTNCPACMEKWKLPLPSPKTPRLKESDVLPELYVNGLKTNNHQRIARLINKAMFDLESYDKRYSKENETFKKIYVSKKDIEETLDNVYLNPMDLAKIEQEIKEKETQKKLENFLIKYSKDRK